MGAPEPGTQRFKLDIQWWTIAPLFVGLVLFLVIAVAVLLESWKDPAKGAGVPVALVFLAAPLLTGYYYLRFPYTITLHDDGSVAFTSLFRTIRIAAHEITSITPHRGTPGFLLVKSRHKRLLIVNQFTGFHVFLTLLKAVNPSVELRGC